MKLATTVLKSLRIDPKQYNENQLSRLEDSIRFLEDNPIHQKTTSLEFVENDQETYWKGQWKDTKNRVHHYEGPRQYKRIPHAT